MNIRRHLHLPALCAAIAVMPFGVAHAQTVEAALDRFQELVQEQGLVIEWDSADISGSDAVLSGVRVGGQGDPDDLLPINNIQLSGIAQTDEGYRIDSISMDDMSVNDEQNNRFELSGVSMEGVLLPDDAVRDNYGGFLFYEAAGISAMRVQVENTEVFSMTDAHVTISPLTTGEPMEFSGAIEEFTLDLSLAKGTEQYPVIEALGFETMTGFMAMEGSWNPQDGRLDMWQNDISVTNAGTLGIALDLGGYTPAFITSLREIQKQMAANPGGDTSAQGFAILGLMQQLTFHSAEIAYADDSLTDKVLELVASQQSMSKTDIVAIAKGMVPFALAQLGNPDFTTATTQAVSSFLDKPQNLRVRAEPASPVPFALIMAEGMGGTPQSLIKSLNVTVTANDE